MSEHLSGIVERITFHSPETGFAVVRVRVRGHRELVTVIGKTLAIHCGEHLEATGAWHMDRQHGRQFKADRLVTANPASAAGIQKYLASGAVRGIGPKLAERIVNALGDQTLDLLDRWPERLLDISGIGPGRLKRISQSWNEQREVRKIMVFLSEHGIAAGRAIRIYRTYGDQAIARIRHNPFCLARDIRGIGFRTADELAQRLGIAPDHTFRLEAGLVYTLFQLSTEGHCASPENELIDQAARLLETDSDKLTEPLAQVLSRGDAVRETIGGEPWIYLTHLYWAEVRLQQRLTERLTLPVESRFEIDVEKALSWVQDRFAIRLADAQQEAIRQAVTQRTLIVTGGPGVGKTTLIRSLLEIFVAKRQRCVLAAPTGRAAKRLSETTGREARTLHRLLEFDPSRQGFRRQADHPLEGDLFIIDEASMIDVVLADQLLQAIPPEASLVWVGDVDQLPSVGPGNVLDDLIQSGTVPIVRLHEIFRQAQESRIVAAAHAIQQGEVPEPSASEELTDFYVIAAEDPETIVQRLLKMVQDRIPKRFGLDPRHDVQILSPMNRSSLGSRQLNIVLQDALNPDQGQAEVERFGVRYRVGDRVLQLVNNYDRDVYNGDQGIITSLNRVEQELHVDFDGRDVAYDFGDLDELTLAYAMSIHKSQGSEFPCVIIPLHMQHYTMLQRNLLYTAVTRGKQLTIIIGSRAALKRAVQRQGALQRHTALGLRLQHSLRG